LYVYLTKYFYVLAYIGEASGERFGILFVGCCGVLGALAILPVVVLSFKKTSKVYFITS